MLECFFNKRDPTQVLLSCEICEIFKNTFLLRDTSHGCFCFMTMNIEAIRCFVKELFPRVLESLMSMRNLVERISFPRIPLKWEFYICSFDKLDKIAFVTVMKKVCIPLSPLIAASSRLYDFCEQILINWLFKLSSFSTNCFLLLLFYKYFFQILHKALIIYWALYLTYYVMWMQKISNESVRS